MKNKGYAFRSGKGEVAVKFAQDEKFQSGHMYTMSFPELEKLLQSRGMENVRGLRIREDGIHVYRGEAPIPTFHKPQEEIGKTVHETRGRGRPMGSKNRPKINSEGKRGRGRPRKTPVAA